MAATLGLSGYTLEGNQIVWRYLGQTPSVASPYASSCVPLHPGYSIGYPATRPACRCPTCLLPKTGA
jgi:hypothetical protein